MASSLLMSRVAMSTLARRSVNPSAFRSTPRQILPQRRNFANQSIRDETDHMYGKMVSHEERYRQAILRVVERDTHEGRRAWTLGILSVSALLAGYVWSRTSTPDDGKNVLLAREVRHVADQMIQEAEEKGLPNPFPKDRTHFELKQGWLDLFRYTGEGPYPEIREEHLQTLHSMKEQDLAARTIYQPHPEELPKVSLWGRLGRQFIAEWRDESYPEMELMKMLPRSIPARVHRGHWTRDDGQDSDYNL